MQKWEYMTAKDCDERELNHLGQEGWELLYIIDRGGFWGIWSDPIFYFKRAISN
jgi:hypothetical protein